jgi:cytochrome c1
VKGANGKVGPPLTDFRDRKFIAGKFPNTPQNLKDWIQHPQELDPGVDMPDMNVTDQDAQDIVAYLYTLH